MTSGLGTALSGVAHAALGAGLPQSSQLVELYGAVTFPGAAAQGAHTDISPATQGVGAAAVAPLVTAWLAVQPVHGHSGPTTVVPGSHRRLAERSARLEREDEADRATEAELWFEPDLQRLHKELRAGDKLRALLADEERELSEFGPADAPHELLLECGDVALMDCRISHFGSAYPRSVGWRDRWPWSSTPQQAPRVLIGATFASAGREAQRMRGFTYYRDSDLVFATLADLLQDA